MFSFNSFAYAESKINQIKNIRPLTEIFFQQTIILAQFSFRDSRKNISIQNIMVILIIANLLNLT